MLIDSLAFQLESKLYCSNFFFQIYFFQINIYISSKPMIHVLLIELTHMTQSMYEIVFEK
jgi:hypothetical protein